MKKKREELDRTNMPCGFCRNLGLSQFAVNSHFVKHCTRLAKTRCLKCREFGHTISRCTAQPLGTRQAASEQLDEDEVEVADEFAGELKEIFANPLAAFTTLPLLPDALPDALPLYERRDALHRALHVPALHVPALHVQVPE